MSTITFDEALDNVNSVLSKHNEHMQQLMVFLTLPFKFKYEPLIKERNIPMIETSELMQADMTNYLNYTRDAYDFAEDYNHLRNAVSALPIEWYYISYLENVFVQLDGLKYFLEWVARNQNTQPLNRAFLMYLDKVYANGIEDANWYCK